MTCKHCGAPTCHEFPTVCGHCAMFRAGGWVSTPAGKGQVTSVKHSGGFIVYQAGVGERLYRGMELALCEAPPATTEPMGSVQAPAKGTSPICTPPTPTTLSQEQAALASLADIQQAEKLRLERVWLAFRLEMLRREFGPFARAQSR